MERSRSRSQGLLPFIKIGDSGFTYVDETTLDGNWGGFPANPCELAVSGKTYMDAMYRYFKIWKQLRNGIYLKTIVVSTEDCECAPYGISWTENFNEPVDTYDYVAFDKKYFYKDERSGNYFLFKDEPAEIREYEYIVLVDDVEEMKRFGKYISEDNSWSEYCKYIDENYLGRVNIPQEMVDLGDKVPYVMYYADIPDYLKWMKDNENTIDCCLKKLWERRGGSEFMHYLESQMPIVESAYEKAIQLISDCDSGDTIPYIKIPLFLEQNSADEGVFVEDEDVYVIEPNNKVRWSASTEDEWIEVPSYLNELVHTPLFFDDNKFMLPGTLVKFSDEDDIGFFECTYYEMQSNPPKKEITVKFEYVTDTNAHISVTSAWCETEEQTPWPYSASAYQIMGAKVDIGSDSTSSGESTEYFVIGSEYNGGQIVSSTTWTTEIWHNFSWWEAVKIDFDPDKYAVADGEDTNECKNKDKYRTLTMLETIEALVPSDFNIDDRGPEDLSNGDTYYFLVRYDNGAINPQQKSGCDLNVEEIICEYYKSANIQFDVGVPRSLTSIDDSGTFIGDCVLSAETNLDETNITFTYVIGGTFTGDTHDYVENTGTVLVETHPYVPNKEFILSIDGVSAVSVYCNYVDFESDKKVGVSPYNGLSGLTNTAFITAMTTGDVWASEYGTIRSVIFKEDYLLGVSYVPETNIDVSYNNGTASAWEKHFKLGECNTYNDLVDYNNGSEFNIE